MLELDIDRDFKLLWQVGSRDENEANYILLLHYNRDSSNIFLLGITEDMREESCFLEKGIYHFINPFSSFIINGLIMSNDNLDNISFNTSFWTIYESIEVRDKINFEKNIRKKQEYIMKRVKEKMTFIIDEVRRISDVSLILY